MNSVSRLNNYSNFLWVILFLQAILYAVIFFNIPVAREVLGFAYFSFIPGFVIVKLLKLKSFSELETILYSVGVSIAFLMLVGVLVNQLGLVAGITRPLTLLPLIVSLNVPITIGAVFVSIGADRIEIFHNKSDKISPFGLLFMILPVLSIVGAMLVNAYSSNQTLLVMLALVSLLSLLGVISEKLLPPRLYPLALILVATSLLYHSSLISRYIVTFGSDVNVEHFLFRMTQNSGYWSSSAPLLFDPLFGRTNAMLSVTVLPTICTTLLNTDSESIFKIIFPLIFALVPLGLYQLWQTYFSKKLAFVASFLFMAQSTFYTEMLGLNRQMIGELFFVLLLLTFLNRKMNISGKVILISFLSFALVTSHYALAEIFLLFMVSVPFSLIALRKVRSRMLISMIVLFFVLMFAWYIFTSNSSVFESFISFANYVYNQFGEFANPLSRGNTVLRGIGIDEVPTIWNALSRVFAYITEALILIGFIGLVLRRRNRFDTEFFLLITAAMIALLAVIVVPGLANTFNMTRFYHILLFFLAPLCVLGAQVIFGYVSKREREIVAFMLAMAILMPYFLFQTGFMYEVTKTDSWSLPLSGYRMSPYRLYYDVGYTDGWAVFGAKWISENVGNGQVQVYGDLVSRINVLVSYGQTYEIEIQPLSNTTTLPSDGMVYLNPLNVIYETVVISSYTCSTDELAFLAETNRVYTNGGSEICRNLP